MITENFSPIRELKKVAKTYHIVIVGGGIAGLSALNQLKNRDVMLCELSPTNGGTSSAHSYTILNRELLEIARYSCGLTQSDRKTLNQT